MCLGVTQGCPGVGTHLWLGKSPNRLCRTGLEFERILANQRNGLKTDAVLFSKVNAMHVNQQSGVKWDIMGEVKARGCHSPQSNLCAGGDHHPGLPK